MVLSHLLRLTNFSSPLLRTVAPTVFAAFAIQGAFAAPSILAQSERFYDLSGSLTYLSCTALSLALPALRARAAGKFTGGLLEWNWDVRQLVLSGAVGLWAVRLGSFLFSRITADNGTDSRFDSIRSSPPKFLVAFFAQATWVSLCLLPVSALNSLPITSLATQPGITVPLFRASAILPILLLVFGLTFEVLADRQKSSWLADKRAKKHDEDFLTSGLWGRSRHPNYFGEISFWSGVAATAAGVLASEQGQRALGWSGSPAARLAAVGVCAASPAFTTFLLTKVSGIPLSENKYDKKYGDREDYQRWKRETPMLIPRVF